MYFAVWCDTLFRVPRAPYDVFPIGPCSMGRRVGATCYPDKNGKDQRAIIVAQAGFWCGVDGVRLVHCMTQRN